MPEISLTTLVDFVVKSGIPRITCVRRAKELYEKGYTPAFDFWKPLREAIVQMHRKNLPKQELDQVLNAITDRKKLALYPARIQAYKRWMGRKKFEWFDCDIEFWKSGELTVRVNPELGLTINGVDYLIKLYFKEEKLSKQRVDIILFLIQNTFSESSPNAIPGIMDVARGNLITPTRKIENIEALLEGEAAAFVHIWERV